MELWTAWVKVALYFAISFLLLLIAIRKRKQILISVCSAVVGLVFSGVALFSTLGNIDRSSQLLSPKGTYVARILVGAGSFLYPADTRVIVRRQRQLTWQTAYDGPGWSAGGGEGSHWLEWGDDTHLVIHYHGSATDLKSCQPKLGPVFIECRSHIW